jgi:hypothetical protein
MKPWTMNEARDDGIPQSVRDEYMAECLARATARRAERNAEEDALAAYGQLLDAKPAKPVMPTKTVKAPETKKLGVGESVTLAKDNRIVHFTVRELNGQRFIGISRKNGMQRKATTIESVEHARYEYRRLLAAGYRRKGRENGA